MAKAKSILAWGGFLDGKLDQIEVDDGWGGFGIEKRKAPAVFRTRAEARRRYRDVRPVLIVVRPE